MATPLVPPVHLGAVPAIASRAQAETALHCLSWLASQRMRIHADRDRKIALEAGAAEARLALQVDPEGEPTTVAAYEQLLQAEVERWALESPAEFADERTLKLPHGSIGLRKNPDSIGFVGEKPKLVAKVTGLVGKGIDAVLKKLGLLLYWRVKLEPDLREIKRAVDAGEVGRGDLRKNGFQYCDGEDRVEVKLGVTVAAESDVAHETC